MTTTSLRRGVNFSLRSRILLLFLLAISLVTLMTLFLTRDATYRHSKKQLESQHLAASRVVADRLITRATLLREGLRDLSHSFSLKQLVASAGDDPQSLRSAMENYQQRLGGDFFLVLDGSGSVLASSSDIPFPSLTPSIYANEGLTWADLGDQHYLLKSAALRFAERSQRVNAWLLMGQRSERLISDELVALTGVQISLARLDETPSIWGTTLARETATELAPALRGIGTGISEIHLKGTHQVAGVHKLVGQPDLYTVATIPQDAAYLNYRELLTRLGLLLLLAGGIAFAAAMGISQSIAGPINALVGVANRISKGEEATDFPQTRTREVRVLTRAIQDMQEGIRDREQEIHRLAFHDDLTGLPNRNRFVTELNARLLESKGDYPLTIALMDVDRFTEINDTMGHPTGDRLLLLIAERLRATIQEGEFLARLGGDEFAIISSSNRARKPALYGNELLSAFEQAFSIEGLLLDVDVSIGLVVAPEHGNNEQELLQKVDIAMYSAKGTHDTFRVYEDALNKHSVKRLSLMAELKEALVEGQLSLYYQPKLTLASNTVSSVECLIRWHHPTQGFIPPDEFIPLAEQTGAIREVTHWALLAALQQQQEWAAQGHRIGVAVNISAVDLVDMRLPAYVGELQTRFGLEQGDLTLEVTESTVMHDPEGAMLALQNLQRMGIKLSIDDFGTGFSSMAQLKQMPVCELKIDKAFVQGLASNRDDQVMVRTLITLADNLSLDTVAEGVEDEESLRILREMGCSFAQGYHLSRPVPAADLDTWLNARQQLRAVEA